MKKKTKKILYWTLLIFGAWIIFSAIVELFGGVNLTQIIPGLIMGAILLFIASKIKSKSQDKKKK